MVKLEMNNRKQWRIQDCPEGGRFCPKNLMTFFNRHTLDFTCTCPYVSFKLNSSEPVYYSNLPFHVTLDIQAVHLTKFSPLPTRIASKNFFVSEGGSSEPNEPPPGSALENNNKKLCYRRGQRVGHA